MLHGFKSIGIGIERRWRTAGREAFAILGLMWLLTEMGSTYKPFEDWIDANGATYLKVAIAIGLVTFLIASYERRSVEFKIPTVGTKLRLYFGDIFKADTNIAIGANEFFDTELGRRVAPGSLHGQLIQTEFGGDESRFQQALDQSLVGKLSRATTRQGGRSLKYDIGTTAVLPIGHRTAFLVALANTDIANDKASCDVPTYWIALRGLLESVHVNSNGIPVTLPLMGNGLAGVNVDPQHLLRLLTLAVVDFARKRSLPPRVSIVLPNECFEALDLREIKRDWSSR